MNKLLLAAIKLFRRKEKEGFNRLSSLLIQKKIYPELGNHSGPYGAGHVWAWGKKRWGEEFIKMEYEFKEEEERDGQK